jgi:hypothetical protein
MLGKSCRWPRSAAPLVVLGLVGCGGAERAAAPARHHAAPPPAPAATGPQPCLAAARRAVASSRVTTRVTAVSPGMATCVYEAPGLRVDVAVDTNPQVLFRFDRAVVERGQNAVWSHKVSQAPRMLHRIGMGADWFPAERELLTTDGRRLISVTLVRTRLGEHARQRLARAVARATLAGRRDG